MVQHQHTNIEKRINTFETTNSTHYDYEFWWSKKLEQEPQREPIFIRLHLSIYRQNRNENASLNTRSILNSRIFILFFSCHQEMTVNGQQMEMEMVCACNDSIFDSKKYIIFRIKVQTECKRIRSNEMKERKTLKSIKYVESESIGCRPFFYL